MLFADYLTPLANSAGPDPASTALAPIPAGTTVAAFSGRIAAAAEGDGMSADAQARTLQIDDELFLVDGDETISVHPVSHSCPPNCHLVGATVVVASRPIGPGEALSIDYATCVGSVHGELECNCGAASCRG